MRSGEFVLIHVATGAITPLPLAARAAVDPIMCLQVADPIDEAQQEYVLCYNKTVEFKHANAHNSRQYNVNWSSRPHAIAYIYPYLLGYVSHVCLGPYGGMQCFPRTGFALDGNEMK